MKIGGLMIEIAKYSQDINPMHASSVINPAIDIINVLREVKLETMIKLTLERPNKHRQAQLWMKKIYVVWYRFCLKVVMRLAFKRNIN